MSFRALAIFSTYSIRPPWRRSPRYHVPSETQKEALVTSVRAAIDEEEDSVVQLASKADYSVCRGVLGDVGLTVWRPKEPRGGGPLLVIKLI